MPLGVVKELLELCASREKFTFLYTVRHAPSKRIRGRRGRRWRRGRRESHVSTAKICEVGGCVMGFIKGASRIPETWLTRIKDGPFTVKFSATKCVILSVDKYVRAKRRREVAEAR